MKVPCIHGTGFTLLELMVSMAISTIILLLAAALLGSSGQGYGRAADGVACGREGRVAFCQLTADLASAVVHRGEVLDSSSGHGIGFLSLQSPDAQSGTGRIGDACAVIYQLEDLPIGGHVRRCLTRSVRESGETLANLRVGQTESLFSGRKEEAEPLAFGVVDFEAIPKSLSTGGEWTDWEMNDTIPPDALEVTLVIARSELLGRLQTTADWDALDDGGHDRSGLETHSGIIRFGNHGHR